MNCHCWEIVWLIPGTFYLFFPISSQMGKTNIKGSILRKITIIVNLKIKQCQPDFLQHTCIVCRTQYIFNSFLLSAFSGNCKSPISLYVVIIHITGARLYPHCDKHWIKKPSQIVSAPQKQTKRTGRHRVGWQAARDAVTCKWLQSRSMAESAIKYKSPYSQPSSLATRSHIFCWQPTPFLNQGYAR